MRINSTTFRSFLYNKFRENTCTRTTFAFPPLLGGCSEGLDAFTFFFEHQFLLRGSQVCLLKPPSNKQTHFFAVSRTHGVYLSQRDQTYVPKMPFGTLPAWMPTCRTGTKVPFVPTLT